MPDETASEILTKMMDVYADIGEPVMMDIPATRNPDGTVNADAYFTAVRAVISEGFCPLDGSRLTPGRSCYHSIHGEGGVMWDKDGSQSHIFAIKFLAEPY